MELWMVFLFLTLLFVVLGLKSGRAAKRTAASGTYTSTSESGEEQKVEIVAETTAEAPPDVFNEDRVRVELAHFARTPGIVAQFLGRARSGFTKAGERAIIRDWTSFFEKAQALIGAKTEMERKRSEYLQLANEHDVRAKEKEVAVAGHDAQIAEESLRRETSEYKRQHLEQFIDGARQPEPKLSPAQQRMLKRAELERDLQRLKLDEAEALQKADTELEKRRIQNMYAGRRSELTEQLERNL